MVELIKSMMGGWDMSGNELESRRGGWLGEEATGRGGWRDDRMQLKLPEETAAALRRCFATCNLHLIFYLI